MKVRIFLIALLVTGICLPIQYFLPFLPTLLPVGWVVKGALLFGIVLIICYILSHVTNKENPIHESFFSTLLLWIAALFVPVTICLTPVIWLHIFLRGAMNMHCFSASLIAILMVTMITFVTRYALSHPIFST